MADNRPVARETTVVREYVPGAAERPKTPVRQHLRKGVGKLGKAASKVISPFRSKHSDSPYDPELQALGDDADALADALSRLHTK